VDHLQFRYVLPSSTKYGLLCVFLTLPILFSSAQDPSGHWHGSQCGLDECRHRRGQTQGRLRPHADRGSHHLQRGGHAQSVLSSLVGVPAHLWLLRNGKAVVVVIECEAMK